MSLNPFIKTEVDTASEEAVNAARTVSIQIIAPCAESLVVGQVYEFTNKAEALAILGNDFSKGNIAPLIIEELYAVQDAWKIYYSYPGSNVDSATTTDLDETSGILAGTKTFTLTSATGFSTGDYITIGTGDTEEYRKILGVSTNDITVNALDYDHSDAEPVVLITQFTVGNVATCRAALIAKEGELYIEDSYGSTEDALLKTYLETRETNELFTLAFRGFPFGTSEATAKSEATTNNSKYMIYNYGLVKLEDKDLLVDGVMLALKSAAAYGNKLSRQRVQNKVPISMNNIQLSNALSVVANDDDVALTITELNALINNYVTAFKEKRIRGVNAVRVYKMVTSYNKDGGGQPSVTYSNIVDVSAEIYMRNNVIDKFDEWSVGLAEAGDDLTTSTDDQVKAQAKVQGILDAYDFLDRDAYEPTVVVDSPSAGNLEFTISYKTVESADQITFVFAKQIR